MDEIWKDIAGYDGKYKISNYGSLKGYWREERNLHPSLDKDGYKKCVLCKGDGTKKTFRICILVWDTFKNDSRNGLQIDHIDEDKQNDFIDNLQLLTSRQNTAKGKQKYRIFPTGVHRTGTTKFRAIIYTNGKNRNLGFYGCPLLASIAYQNALAQLV